MLRMLPFYCIYHQTCLGCEDESLQPSQKSVVTCCSRCGWKWLIGL